MSKTITVDVLVYAPGSMMPKPHRVEMPDPPRFADMNREIGKLIGVGNHIEHVAVLFREKPHDMFVDEFSALPVHGGERLPINDAATLIYHEASRRRGADLTDAPKIHGVAVVALTKIWT